MKRESWLAEFLRGLRGWPTVTSSVDRNITDEMAAGDDAGSPANSLPIRVTPNVTQVNADALYGAGRANGQVSPSRSGAHIRILNLSPLERQFGADWSRIEKHVHKLVENTLSRHLGRKDTFRRAGATAYVVTFADADRDDAELQMTLIAQELKRLMFASEEPALVTADPFPEIEVTIVDMPVGGARCEPDSGASAVRSVVSFSTADPLAVRVSGLVETSEQALRSMFDKVVMRPEPHELLRIQSFLEHLRSLEHELASALSQAASATLQASAPILNKPHPSSAAKFDTSGSDPLPALIHRIKTLTQDGEKRVSQLVEQNAFRADFHRVFEDGQELSWIAGGSQDFLYSVDYLPIVDVRTSIIGIHRAKINVKFTASDLSGAERHAIENSAAYIQQCDRLLLQAALRDLSMSRGRSQIVVIGVNQESLEAVGARNTYIREGATRIPIELRGMVAFEIVMKKLPRLVELARWIEDLAPFCRAVFIRLRRPSDLQVLEIGTLPAQVRTRLSAIGFSSPEETDERDFLIDMEQLAVRAEALSLRSYVANVGTHSSLIAALASGIGYVFGERMFPPVPNPGNARKTTLADIVIDSIDRTRIDGACGNERDSHFSGRAGS